MAGCTARGGIIIENEERIAEAGFTAGGCHSLQNAKRHVLRRLCNILRTHHEGREGFIWWPNLPKKLRNQWLDRVSETLQWIELNDGKGAHFNSISSKEFARALQQAVA
jgi:hypothetical protein